MNDLQGEVKKVLAAHGPSGFVNSKEGWVECECGERLYLPSGLTFDGYAEMWEEERQVRDAHVAAALAEAGLLVDRDWGTRMIRHTEKLQDERDTARTELAHLRSNIKRVAKQLSQMGDKDGLRIVLELLDES